MIGRRRGPGLLRAAATTAVVAGTAGAVRHRQERRYAEQDQAEYEQQAAAAAAAQSQQAQTAAPGQADVTAELERLGQLKEQGIIDDEEFAAAKKQLLGI
jgi:type IV secretory pathway VirB9-like protein